MALTVTNLPTTIAVGWIVSFAGTEVLAIDCGFNPLLGFANVAY